MKEHFEILKPKSDQPELEHSFPPVDEKKRIQELMELLKTSDAFLVRHKGTVTIRNSKGEPLFHENEKAFERAIESYKLTQELFKLEEKKAKEPHDPSVPVAFYDHFPAPLKNVNEVEVTPVEMNDPLVHLSPQSEGDIKGH